MNSNHKYQNLKLAVISVFAISTLIVMSDVYAKKPFTAAEKEDQMNMLMASVKKGDDLWHNPGLCSNGLACGNCHPDGSATNPHTWPKYQTNLGKVGTLRGMINWCIAVPLLGKPLELNSEEMIAMEAYVMYTHRGVAIAPAKDEQHGAVPVVSGSGYPNAVGGNR